MSHCETVSTGHRHVFDGGTLQYFTVDGVPSFGARCQRCGHMIAHKEDGYQSFKEHWYGPPRPVGWREP